jgi:hypothetical protein
MVNHFHDTRYNVTQRNNKKSSTQPNGTQHNKSECCEFHTEYRFAKCRDNSFISQEYGIHRKEPCQPSSMATVHDIDLLRSIVLISKFVMDL